MTDKKTASEISKELTENIEKTLEKYTDKYILRKISEIDAHHTIVISEDEISLYRLHALKIDLQALDLSVDMAISTRAVYIQVW